MTDQTQQARREGAEPPRPPVPDLGFFAGSPAPSAGSPVFGGSPVGAAPSPFGTPAAPPFATPAPFGGPAPFDTPAPWTATGAHPGRTGWSGRATALVAAAGVIVLVAVVLGGRFGWQQFVADPMLPDRLAGMPRVTGPAADQATAQMADQVGALLSAGSKTRVGLYTYGRGIGYLVVAVRGGVKSGSGGSGDGPDSTAGWTKTEVNGATCMSKSVPSAQGPVGTTFCTRGFWRRAVIVYGFSTLLPQPAAVAAATAEAWDAQ
jgi:hypothetical protein